MCARVECAWCARARSLGAGEREKGKNDTPHTIARSIDRACDAFFFWLILKKKILARITGLTAVLFLLFMFVGIRVSPSVAGVRVVEIGIPDPWLRTTEYLQDHSRSYEFLVQGFVVDTVIWLLVSVVISLVLHIGKM